MALPRKGQERGEKDQVRSFICIEIPRSIQSRLDELQQKLRTIGADVGWVKTSNIHLTLKFLGDVAQSRIAAVRSAIAKACEGQGPIELVVAGTGAFPSLRNPRVLWVGLPAIPETLQQLQKTIEDQLEHEEFPRETKPFSPHLTLGRIRSARKTAPLTDALTREGFASIGFVANRITLMRSQLSPGGSIYTPLAEIPLARPTSVHLAPSL